jgi:hypothetical protein
VGGEEGRGGCAVKWWEVRDGCHRPFLPGLAAAAETQRAPSGLGAAREPGAGWECRGGRAGCWGDRREESRPCELKDYISQAATLSSGSPRAPTAPQFPQGSAGLPCLLCALLFPLGRQWRKATFPCRPDLTLAEPNKTAGAREVSAACGARSRKPRIAGRPGGTSPSGGAGRGGFAAPRGAGRGPARGRGADPPGCPWSSAAGAIGSSLSRERGARSAGERRLQPWRSPPPTPWAGPSVTFASALEGSGRAPEATWAAVSAAWLGRRCLGDMLPARLHL